MIFQFTGTDAMNTAINQMSSDGQCQRQYFSPYGGIFTALAHKSGFNGERCDPLTGATHLGNGYRAYNPVLMRFHCPDSMSPFGAGGINTYAYCSGDPINNSDPSGHMSAQAGGGISLGVLGLALGTAMFGVSIAAKVAVVASVAAIGTGIASAATEESNPEASTVLGWVSAGLGIVGAAFGVKGIKNVKASKCSLIMKTKGVPDDSTQAARAMSSGRSGLGVTAETQAAWDALPPENRALLEGLSRKYALRGAAGERQLTGAIGAEITQSINDALESVNVSGSVRSASPRSISITNSEESRSTFPERAVGNAKKGDKSGGHMNRKSGYMHAGSRNTVASEFSSAKLWLSTSL